MIETKESAPLDRYQVLYKLGQGRHGAVHAAIDRASGERIALKELRSVTARTLAHFKQEFRAMQEVHHPNLVRLDALFEDRGKWVIAMELVEGTDLLSYLYVDDVARCFHEPKLRDAFLQLAKGLEALHAAGLVHRDIKPANVRVTPEGRVVLLDFGLAAEIEPRGASMRPMGLGTLAYMAPEQAERKNVGPPADWYAFGVCLYEALSGIRPIDADNPSVLIAAKRILTAQPVSNLAPGIPLELERLCSSLLNVSPAARPTARAVRRVLQGSIPLRSSLPALASITPGQRPSFQGREKELERLEQAFERCEAGAFQALIIEGDSGIGKSALAESFISRPRNAVLLRSRCYENELVAFKAFDGAIDGLIDYLGKLSLEECTALLPDRVGVLCRMFPAFEGFPPIARAPLAGLPAEPSAQRMEAFAVFGELLRKIGERAPIVFVIDDLQWADGESFRLLQAFLTGPAAHCLVVATTRPRTELEGDAAAHIAALRKLPCVDEIMLTGLPGPAATALARSLMAASMPDAWLETIVRESGGHPLFLTVLARFAENQVQGSNVELTLDLAIKSRIDALDSDARRLLQTVAVAGTPLAAPLCGQAADISDSDLTNLATDLCRQKLLRRRRAGEIACFHDHIRRAVLERLPVDQARELHRQIAVALSQQEAPDDARLARHFEAGGELAPALQAYAAAGRQALDSLAFERADLLLGRALAIAELLERPAAERLPLLIERGHALARGGRSAQAARVYLEAAPLAEGEHQTQLRIWAAQHLMQSAQVEEGMKTARALLAELGVAMPTGLVASRARLLWDRFRLGRAEVELPESPRAVTPRERMQLDALWGLALPIAWLDPLASVGLTTRHLLLARSVGDPAHLGRALAEESFTRQFSDPYSPRSADLIAQARELCNRSGDPALDVCVAFREATYATVNSDLTRARERLEHAHRVATEHCPGEPWLLTNVRILLGTVYHHSAQHAMLASATSNWLLDARDRNDHFALTLLEGVGMGHIRHLMQGEIDHARAMVAASLAPWPREPFSYAHFGEALSVLHIECARGGDGALRFMRAEHAALERTLLLKRGFGRTAVLSWRARACLAAHAKATRSERTALLEEARGYVAQLRRIDLLVASVTAALLGAQVAALEGRVDAARSEIAQARTLAGERHNVLLTHTLDYLDALLVPGTDGRTTRAKTLAYFAAQGWSNPARALALLAPCVDSLEQSRG